ncbi:MAG: hypothetical protein H6R15_3929 [Proteobacteria bacterium]|nr:hypothetical protein [Pseudomonadota bacterium]
MKKLLCLLALCFAASAQAYSVKELREDCQAADESLVQKKSTDANDATKSARCISYVSGFADGYAVSDYLADKVGVKLNAFCLPHEPDLAARLVRAVLAHLEHLPPNPSGSTAMLVASALGKSFSCPDSLESKK